MGIFSIHTYASEAIWNVGKSLSLVQYSKLANLDEAQLRASPGVLENQWRFHFDGLRGIDCFPNRYGRPFLALNLARWPPWCSGRPLAFCSTR